MKVKTTVQHNVTHCVYSDVKNTQNSRYMFRPYLGHPQVCATETAKYVIFSVMIFIMINMMYTCI
jgi:hypothetical protein